MSGKTIVVLATLDTKGREVDRLIGEVPKKTLETFIEKNASKR